MCLAVLLHCNCIVAILFPFSSDVDSGVVCRLRKNGSERKRGEGERKYSKSWSVSSLYAVRRRVEVWNSTTEAACVRFTLVPVQYINHFCMTNKELKNGAFPLKKKGVEDWREYSGAGWKRVPESISHQRHPIPSTSAETKCFLQVRTEMRLQNDRGAMQQLFQPRRARGSDSFIAEGRREGVVRKVGMEWLYGRASSAAPLRSPSFTPEGAVAEKTSEGHKPPPRWPPAA